MLTLETKLSIESQIFAAIENILPKGYQFHFTLYEEVIDKEEMRAKEIRELICRYLGIDTPAIFKKTRKGEVATARKLICYFLKKNTRLNLKQIATLAGYCTGLAEVHTYAIHNINTIKSWIGSDETITLKVNEISQLISLNALQCNPN
jgi:chromosomal replication initiation ATPase DnaA